MAKFRVNHNRNKTSGNMIRFGLYAIILLILLWYGLQKILGENQTKTSIQTKSEEFYWPKGKNEQVIHHTAYSLSYLEEHEQSEWIAYRLTKELLKIPNVQRAKEYRSDPNISTGSAVHSDYTRSGYTRGHLAPAGDMAHDRTTMQESFFMSNISPQKRAFNNGIWKELEETIRDWAFDYGELIIITGPLLDKPVKKIGKNRVSVPHAFYKIIYAEDQEKMIGFIIPNQLSEKPLSEYTVTVDSIESLTKIDFFINYLNDDFEETLESRSNLSKWNFSKKRYLQRVNNWNIK
jgi:endonuclease G